LVFCNRKLMRTDNFLTRSIKPICNFANPAILATPHWSLAVGFFFPLILATKSQGSILIYPCPSVHPDIRRLTSFTFLKMFCRVHVHAYTCILKVCIITDFDFYQTDKLETIYIFCQNPGGGIPVSSLFWALFSNLHFFYANLMWQQFFLHEIQWITPLLLWNKKTSKHVAWK
jgi:hypothetical protein